MVDLGCGAPVDKEALAKRLLAKLRKNNGVYVDDICGMEEVILDGYFDIKALAEEAMAFREEVSRAG